MEKYENYMAAENMNITENKVVLLSSY